MKRGAPMKRTPMKRSGSIKPKPTREKAREKHPGLATTPWWLAVDGQRAKMLMERACRVCGGPAESFHHVPGRGQGGLNCADAGGPCCGDGVRGCHGLLEAMDEDARREYGVNMPSEEKSYVLWLFGEERGREYLRVRYFVDVPRLWPVWRGADLYDRPKVVYD